MDFQAFLQSTEESESPAASLSAPLKALWWDRKGDWEKAHEICQEAGSREGDWVHAYLHRAEGDLGNARYWYGRCGEPCFEGSLGEEWEAMAKRLLTEQ